MVDIVVKPRIIYWPWIVALAVTFVLVAGAE